MEESVRLVCPDCDLVYRVKRVVPGKTYTCRACGGVLAPMSEPPEGAEAIANANLAAASSSLDVAAATTAAPAHSHPAPRPQPMPGLAAGESLAEFDSRLERLSRLSDTMAERLDAATGPELSAQLEKLESASRHLRETAGSLEAGMAEQGDGLAAQIREIEAKVAVLAERLDPERLDTLADIVRRTGEEVMARLETHRYELGSELAAIREGRVPAHTDGVTAVDVERLAGMVVAGIAKTSPRFDPESGTVVDALARVANELVREQSANTARLDRLAEDMRSTTSSIGQWQGALPDRVADEIGRTVEERVVGPISGALARQAPAILSELQDTKLVDIVSRSVREAQRPLLREVLAGGRGGVPIWLFASVLLPLLLILGYLFLPGEIGGSDAEERARMESEIVAVADGMHRAETSGLPLNKDSDARLRNIEDVVVDLHGQALEHAKNAAALEEEAKGLRETLGERDRLIKEYSDMLQKQVKRIRAYETRLTRLGVSPDSVEE